MELSLDIDEPKDARIGMLSLGSYLYVARLEIVDFYHQPISISEAAKGIAILDTL